MLEYLRACWQCTVRFRGYEPLPVGPLSAVRWARQFESHLRPHLLKLLEHVVYVGKRQALTYLVSENERILTALATAAMKPSAVVYVGTDDAGSSSHVMLNALRNEARLEQRGYRNYLNWTDQERLLDIVQKERDIAIIYVDDFAGTGRQFCRSRDSLASFLPRPFPEFFLLVACCEEAAEEIDPRGVTIRTSLVHRRVDRPLHPSSTILADAAKAELRSVALSMHPKHGLGFGGLASMVVLFADAPNTIPLVLRGSHGQRPIRGIFPRRKDLPVIPVPPRRGS